MTKTMTMTTNSTAEAAYAAEMAAAFPSIDPGIIPFGDRILLQIRTAKRVSKGGIILVDEARDTEKWNTQIGKVVSLGPLAFHHRTSLNPWPEGAWCQPGDFVRVPKYGGDRWEVDTGGEEPALFVIYKDHEIIGKVVGDPLSIKAFV